MTAERFEALKEQKIRVFSSFNEMNDFFRTLQQERRADAARKRRKTRDRFKIWNYRRRNA